MNFIKSFFPFGKYTAILTGITGYHAIIAILLMAILGTIKPSFTLLKDIRPYTQNLESKILTLVDEVYPQELEIKIKNGQVSTNVTEPYYITIKKETLENLFAFKQGDQNTKAKIRLLAIDTKGKAEEYEKYQSLALLTENSLIYYSDKDIKIYPLREIKDLTINKDYIKSQVKNFNKNNFIGNLISIGIFALPLFIFIGLFITQLIVLLFASLVVLLMIRINQQQFGFGNIFRYTVAIDFVMTLIFTPLTYIPNFGIYLSSLNMVYFIILFGLAYSGIYLIKDSKRGETVNEVH